MDQLPFDVFNLSGTSNVKEKFKDDKMQIRDYLRLQDNVYKTSKSREDTDQGGQSDASAPKVDRS